MKVKSGNKASQLLNRGALGKLPMLHPSSSHGGANGGVGGGKGGSERKGKPKKNRTLDVKVRGICICVCTCKSIDIIPEKQDSSPFQSFFSVFATTFHQFL